MDKDLIQRAKSAKTADELLAMAKENGITMSAEEASVNFKALHPASGELADDELDNVSGGGCGYASASLDGHYYKLVDDRSDSCERFVCLLCGGGRGHHAAGCSALDNHLGNDLSNNCMHCIYCRGDQLIGDYCKLDWR